MMGMMRMSPDTMMMGLMEFMKPKSKSSPTVRE